MKVDYSHYRIENMLIKLSRYIHSQDFKGYDPYDALNSPILKILTFNNTLAGIFWIQLLKFLPVNLRIFLGIKKEYNPKAMGLFLSAYSKKYAITRDKTDLEKIDFFSEWLVQNSAKGYSGLCWGYNFDWANRTF
ncbi:MAG: delta-aminolevulinic acid dehydratase, partial [Elusimicrobiota bacterium]|nr:delta-aminolevulinic acid dehydratase [Endomicrobiia bacterium]MDW8166855.1 delta-aminolevulinic acid dehydratase [Elusimicrobiota bacterium]